MINFFEIKKISKRKKINYKWIFLKNSLNKKNNATLHCMTLIVSRETFYLFLLI